MKEFTYLIYIIFMMVLLFGGTGYAVFILGFSGWWFLLACFCTEFVITPKQWYGED